MAKINQLGPGRKTTGTIDGITYVTRNGVTYARSTPTMPASAYNTPAAKKYLQDGADAHEATPSYHQADVHPDR